jgi:hypothetical protein
LKKGDLGGFENLQGEGIYGKRYKRKELLAIAIKGILSFWGPRRIPLFGAAEILRSAALRSE